MIARSTPAHQGKLAVVPLGTMPPLGPDSIEKLDPQFLGFVAFLLLTFLNIPNRLPLLGIFRPTVVLVLILSIACIARWNRSSTYLRGSAATCLLALLVYLVVSLPFVAWPGSVLKVNFEIFLKAIVFFFFTITFVDTVKKLQILMFAYLGSQLFRVVEPLWLHITEGYWGSETFDGYEKWMDRLAGAPSDLLGPNGLAFVIVSLLPFVHYFAFTQRTFRTLLVYCFTVPIVLYALVLTASRSGMVGLVVVVAGIIALSRRRVMCITVVVTALVFTVPALNPNEVARYQSMYRSDVKGAGTAAGRITGIQTDFEVAMRHPVFGHGLGTSGEALFNGAGGTHISHNMYTESLIELGIFGTAIILLYLLSAWRLVRGSLRSLIATGDRESSLKPILQWMPRALVVWTAMCLVFSLASYGISQYEWYFLGGLAVVLKRLIDECQNTNSSILDPPSGITTRIGTPHPPSTP